ncbi:response regulator [Microvirga calopogonii]|uniref:response regulator n=1 Tax=Microvirga calopogonii TaxID=2078013 RepID=UPI000E0D0018|nr:response regulator [Microvirga calopogonii]
MNALNIQDELQDAGCAVAGPFTSCSAALDWLGAETPAMAILDATLNDGTCSNVDAELTRRKVPFLIYSGHQEKHHLLAEFHHVTWIEKPALPAVLVRACQQLLDGSAKLLGEALNLC